MAPVAQFRARAAFDGHGVFEAVDEGGAAGDEFVQFGGVAEYVGFEDGVGAAALGEVGFEGLVAAVADGDAGDVDGVVAGGCFAEPFVAVGGVPFVLKNGVHDEVLSIE